MKNKQLIPALGVIANLAVVAGIILLAFELKQNTDSVQSATVQAISEGTYESVRIALENPDLRRVMLAINAGEELTAEQYLIMQLFYGAMLRLEQNQFLQMELGVLDADVMAELGTSRFLVTESFRDYWSQNSGEWSDGFREHIEKETQMVAERLRRVESSQ